MSTRPTETCGHLRLGQANCGQHTLRLTDAPTRKSAAVPRPSEWRPPDSKRTITYPRDDICVKSHSFVGHNRVNIALDATKHSRDRIATQHVVHRVRRKNNNILRVSSKTCYQNRHSNLDLELETTTVATRLQPCVP
jgi:hypothetical protein